MTGAMYAGISGLKSHMNKLNVIGNNIANVNTYGYKTARTTFREAIYTTMTAGSDGTDLVGGTNPSQIGYCCNIGTIDLDMSNGPAVPTGVNLDCMIQGDGFFMVGDKSGVKPNDLDSLKLTKVGNFHFDKSGYLVDGYGQVVYGFVTVAGQTQNGQFKPEADAAPDKGTGTTGPSTQLVPIRLPLAALKDDPDNKIAAGDPIYPGVNQAGENVQSTDPDLVNPDKTVAVNVDSISVDKTGKITATTESNKNVTIGYIALGKVENPAGLTHLDGPYYQAISGAGDVAVTTAGGAVTGYLNNEDGQEATDVRIVGSDNILLSGFLEGSGTDLATEFSEMITTQRGYQANTRIVTVTDSMLEELVNMKR